MKEYNDQFMKFVINRMVPFSKVLSYIGHDFEYGTIFCPFHENVNTPAARLYKDERGDSIYCFAEQRLYRPADAITKGLIDSKLERVFERLWNQTSDPVRRGLEMEFEKPAYRGDDVVSQVRQELKGFKTGEFDYDNLKFKLISLNNNNRIRTETDNNYNSDDDKRTDRTNSQVNTEIAHAGQVHDS